MLRMMGFDPDTDAELSVEMTTYGDHIMLGRPDLIAPVPRSKQADELAAIISELSNQGMFDAEFARLSADGSRRFRVLADAQAGRPVNQVTVARLRRCLERVVMGETMEDAIAGTLVEFPAHAEA
jgi:hypothetical protein